MIQAHSTAEWEITAYRSFLTWGDLREVPRLPGAGQLHKTWWDGSYDWNGWIQAPHERQAGDTRRGCYPLVNDQLEYRLGVGEVTTQSSWVRIERRTL